MKKGKNQWRMAATNGADKTTKKKKTKVRSHHVVFNLLAGCSSLFNKTTESRTFAPVEWWILARYHETSFIATCTTVLLYSNHFIIQSIHNQSVDNNLGLITNKLASSGTELRCFSAYKILHVVVLLLYRASSLEAFVIRLRTHGKEPRVAFGRAASINDRLMFPRPVCRSRM